MVDKSNILTAGILVVDDKEPNVRLLEGMLRGAMDLNLPVARGGYHGLRIEMKFGRNKMTDEQEWYAGRLREEGWRVVTCWSWTTAMELIVAYLQGELLK